MSEPYVGELKLNAFNFAPNGWHAADGALLTIQQNMALYALLGVRFGGNATTNFNLPNAQGRALIGAGPGTAGGYYVDGQNGGSATVQLASGQVPAHGHQAFASTNQGTTPIPTGNTMLANSKSRFPPDYPMYGIPAAPPTSTTVALNPASLGITGAAAGHQNMQPSLVLNWCVAMLGIFPPRD